MGTPKSSIFLVFHSKLNHPAIGVPVLLGHLHIIMENLQISGDPSQSKRERDMKTTSFKSEILNSFHTIDCWQGKVATIQRSTRVRTHIPCKPWKNLRHLCNAFLATIPMQANNVANSDTSSIATVSPSCFQLLAAPQDLKTQGLRTVKKWRRGAIHTLPLKKEVGPADCKNWVSNAAIWKRKVLRQWSACLHSSFNSIEPFKLSWYGQFFHSVSFALGCGLLLPYLKRTLDFQALPDFATALWTAACKEPCRAGGWEVRSKNPYSFQQSGEQERTAHFHKTSKSMHLFKKSKEHISAGPRTEATAFKHTLPGNDRWAMLKAPGIRKTNG